MMRMVLYHSREWDELVEQGWRTHEVLVICGYRVAQMVYDPPRRHA